MSREGTRCVHDNSHHLVAAAQRRRADTLERARRALRRAQPNRPAAYHHPDRGPRQHLPRLALRPARTPRPTRRLTTCPTGRRQSTQPHTHPTSRYDNDSPSPTNRIRELDDENRRLRDQIAHLHGQLRANRIAARHGHGPRREHPGHAAKRPNAPEITIASLRSRTSRSRSLIRCCSTVVTPGRALAST